MKINDEQLTEYIDIVKNTYNKELDRNQAYTELYKLVTLVAHLYMPSEILSILEISTHKSYTTRTQ